jgi:hypothetical protein
MRTVHGIDLSAYGTEAALQDKLTSVFNQDRFLRNLGSSGRAQVIEQAFEGAKLVPAEDRLTNLMAMRERGLISASDFHNFAYQMGYTEGQSEYQYRKWSGTEEAVFDTKFKKLYRHGEYTAAYRRKGLTRGQAYYRFKKHEAIRYGIPWRGWHERRPNIRSRRRQQP